MQQKNIIWKNLAIKASSFIIICMAKWSKTPAKYCKRKVSFFFFIQLVFFCKKCSGRNCTKIVKRFTFSKCLTSCWTKKWFLLMKIVVMFHWFTVNVSSFWYWEIFTRKFTSFARKSSGDLIISRKVFNDQSTAYNGTFRLVRVFHLLK